MINSKNNTIKSVPNNLSNVSYEMLTSTNQKLTFNSINAFLKDMDIKFTIVQQKMLRVINAEGLYTNLGYWLSDQYAISSKIVIYENDDMSIATQQKEIFGSIVQQLTEIDTFLNNQNEVHSNFFNNRRIEILDYPKISLTESVINAFVHQDFSLNSSIMIKIFEDRIEITNFGGLINDMAFDDLFIGMSICRNPSLMQIFKYFKLCDGFGTGIGKIRDSYAKSLSGSRIKINNNIFKITLPNQHFANYDLGSEHLSIFETGKMLIILEKLKENGSLSRTEIAKIMDVSSTRSIIILRILIQKEILETFEGKNGAVLYRRAR